MREHLRSSSSHFRQASNSTLEIPTQVARQVTRMRLCTVLPAMAMALTASHPALALDGSPEPREMDRARSLLAERLDGRQLRGTIGDGIASDEFDHQPTKPRTSKDESATAPVSHLHPLRRHAAASAQTKLRHSRLQKRKAVATLQSGTLSLVRLPPNLAPEKADRTGERRFLAFRSEVGFVAGTAADLQLLGQPLTSVPGTSIHVVSACRNAILAAAGPYSPVSVQAVSAGRPRQRGSVLTAPVEIEATYPWRLGREVRRAKVQCRIDQAGRVIGAG
jgi:hypothetical protein